MAVCLWAVHISDGLLSNSWWLGGFVLAGLLIWWGSRRVRDEEIPRIAVLTAAFFVASLIHVRIFGGSAHLLFNALVGMILGPRAVLAIGVGLFLQVLLTGHGGWQTLGINCCVMGLPALAAGAAFHSVKGIRWGPIAHAGLVALATFIWSLTLVYSVTLLIANQPWHTAAGADMRLAEANAVTFHPLTLLLLAALSCLVAMFESRLRNSCAFALGLLIGEVTVLLTVALNCAVLIFGGVANMTFPALVMVVFHLPIALVEGTILGFATAFLARVKPEMLGLENNVAEAALEQRLDNSSTDILAVNPERCAETRTVAP